MKKKIETYLLETGGHKVIWEKISEIKFHNVVSYEVWSPCYTPFFMLNSTEHDINVKMPSQLMLMLTF